MCWASPYTRHKTRTNKQSKKHSTICVFVFVLCLVYGDVQHILCYVFCFVCFSSSCVLCIVMSNTYCAMFFALFVCPRLVSCGYGDVQHICKKINTICVGHHHTQDTRRGQRNKAKNIAQYVLDITIHKTQDRKNKHSKKHSTICIGHHHTQDTRR
jgi:hypothetical protein